MPEDDDMNYPMLNLHVAEQFGPEFRPHDVLQTWLTTLPVLQVFTAERVAYYNALQLFTRRRRPGTGTPIGNGSAPRFERISGAGWRQATRAMLRSWLTGMR